MTWNLEGKEVTAKYLNDYYVRGRVTMSRIRYGATVCHMIDLDRPINLFGADRTSVIVHDSEIISIEPIEKSDSYED